MNFRTGDIVIFITKDMNCRLNLYETYKVTNLGFDVECSGINYISVSTSGKEYKWYDEELFISLKEYRKLKIENINEKQKSRQN